MPLKMYRPLQLYYICTIFYYTVHEFDICRNLWTTNWLEEIARDDRCVRSPTSCTCVMLAIQSSVLYSSIDPAVRQLVLLSIAASVCRSICNFVIDKVIGRVTQAVWGGSRCVKWLCSTLYIINYLSTSYMKSTGRSSVGHVSKRSLGHSASH